MGVLEGGGSYRLTLKSLFDRLVNPDGEIYPGPGTDYQVRGYIGVVRFFDFISEGRGDVIFQNPQCNFNVMGTIKDQGAILAFQYDARIYFPSSRERKFDARAEEALANYLLLQHYMTSGTGVELRGRVRNTNPRLLKCSAVRVNFTDKTHFDHGDISSHIFED